MDRIEQMMNRNTRGGQRVEPSPEMINQLVEMGFSRDRAEDVLRQTGGDVDAATSILLAH